MGAIIRWWTKSDVNHTAMALRLPYYDADRVFILEAMEHGLQLRALSDRLEKFKGEVWHLPLTDDFEPARHEMGRCGLLQIGKGIKYDYAGCILGNIIGRAKKDASQQFCSEFWYWDIETSVQGIEELQRKLTMANVYLDNEAPTPADVRHLGLTKERVRIK